MRTTWTGIASSMGRIGGMICPLVAVVLVTGCHQTAAIILFEVVTVLSAICAFLFPVDTKGRELSDTIGVSKSKEVLVVVIKLYPCTIVTKEKKKNKKLHMVFLIT